jgi:V/A-type H+-transporting ATPase subunit E
MDTQVKELIETIKADGVQAAEKQAEQIVAAAEEKAQHIIAEANKQADSIRSKAETDRQRTEAAGMEALQQSGRDLILGVQARLTAMFKSVVEEGTRSAMSGDALASAIEKVVTAWSQGREEDISILLSPEDQKALESSLRARLGGKLADGAEVVPTQALKNGFRLSTKGGDVYYDFSAEAVADALAAFLAPRLGDALREAVKGA